MGRYGQAILTVVGTVVGAYFGYPQLGALIGSLAGSLLFPTQLPTQRGPALADLTTTNSQVGAPIQEGWGTFVVAGTIIHQTDIREVIETEEVGGKGGPSQTTETPTYYSDWALALVDCPDDPIVGVRVIWANGKPIYDRRPRGDGESDEAYSARMAANAQLDEQMIVYLGTSDQEPDPTLEAFYGLGQVSAHRNLAYIMFSNWLHKPEDGNRIPMNMKVEIVGVGTALSESGVQYAQEELYPWKAGFPFNDRNLHEFNIECSGGAVGADEIELTPIVSINDGLTVMESFRGKPMRVYQGAAATVGGLGGVDIGFTDSMGGYEAIETDWQKAYLHYNTFEGTKQAYGPRDDYFSPPGATYCERLNNHLGFGDSVLSCDGYTLPSIFGDTGNRVYMKIAPGGEASSYWDQVIPNCNGGDGNFGIWLLASVGCVIGVKRIPRAPDDPAEPFGDVVYPKLPGTDDWYVVGGRIVKAGPWTKVTGTFRVLQTFAPGSFSPVRYPLGPALPDSDPRFDDEAFWTSEYLKAVAAGAMPPGLTYGSQYPAGQGFAYQKLLDISTLVSTRIPVRIAVEAICRRAGYTPDQIDTSDIADLDMIGYVRTRQMTARAAIDPLRQAKFFDGYESGRKIRFVRRGGAIQRVFTTDELGVFPSGGERPSKVTTRKLQDTELPRRVRVHYLAQSREYELGQQDSPARVDTRAVNEVDVEIPMVMDDSEAKQAAQVLWADAWASRYLHDIQVSFGEQRLEPTDVIAVPIDGWLIRCRILEVTDSLPSHRKLALARDDDGSYNSSAVADEPPTIPPPLSITSPAALVLLDIPMVRDSDNNVGVYAAMYPLVPGTFRGAAIYRSTDGGGNWVRVATAANAATTGTVVTALPAAGYAAVDGASSLVVELDGDEQLSSITRAALLNGSAGSNAAAIGAHGRWEIVQFQNVEPIGGRLFRLTMLLRGRRGTEHAIGSSQVGDKFVLLTGSGIIRVPMQLSDVGREYLYRAVGTGLTVDSAETITFAGQGVALKPFSPVYIRGTLDPLSGDWTLTWLRRGRIGQTLASGTDIPLSEEVEDYEVVIRAGGAELRVISTNEPTAVYTADQQLTDFGMPVNPLAFEVYQISAAVGRGYPGAGLVAAPNLITI